jgi:hypothetical protein
VIRFIIAIDQNIQIFYEMSEIFVQSSREKWQTDWEM